ncbi:tyrosine-protein phosphatase [Pseudonocardia sp. RS11V-5]|uniref:tyrosine-protein phosphatase n=1 Tax=Pseudonocardia terrae TaxID=2905831 RepID=UPI001E2B9380|nr:tyrosine-protein phosphatase [Pseudonocardia terrae]MCE3551439.1 tyrosine-protein phosphatase [Pseudonocardia terrae]
MSYPGLLGFREVAGLRTRSGGRVRPGLLHRSGTPQFLDLGAGRRLLADTGIVATIDLRLPHEADQEGRGPLDELGVRHARHPVRLRALVAPGSAVAPMPGDDPLVGTYLRYLDEGGEAVAGAVAELLRPGTLPVLLHCTVGKDRTGALVAVLLDALGVHREDIAADYARGAADAAEAMARLRTMVSYGDAVDLYPPEALTAEPGTIHRFLAGVDERHGGSRAFLLDHGLTPAMLDDLEALLVEAPG